MGAFQKYGEQSASVDVTSILSSVGCGLSLGDNRAGACFDWQSPRIYMQILSPQAGSLRSSAERQHGSITHLLHRRTTMLFIALCKMVAVRTDRSVAEKVKSYMVPKSRFESFGLIEPKPSLKTPSGVGKKHAYKQHQQ